MDHANAHHPDRLDRLGLIAGPLAVLILFVWFAGFIVDRTEGWVRDAFQQVNVVRHLDQFNRGLVTLEGLVFFVGAAALFLFLTVKVVESHRWR